MAITSVPHQGPTRFADRRDAGRALARVLHPCFAESPDGVVVLGLPRGGVPVAAEVAQSLGAPLDVIVVRKLGVPWQPELALGAVGEGGVVVWNADVVERAGLPQRQLEELVAREQERVADRATRYRTYRARVGLEGRTAVLVDDGIATGATARAACQVARAHGASRVVLAVPVAPHGWEHTFADVADDCHAVIVPHHFAAVGAYYADFAPTTDGEVEWCLAHQAPQEQQRTIPYLGSLLAGTLMMPSKPRGLVVFAHGSGSSHRSVRNRYVARRMVDAGFATALFDLLTEAEESDRSNVFHVVMLTERLLTIVNWCMSRPDLAGLKPGLFGASTGAAAALTAAATPGGRVAAVVSRGGRPDLASHDLAAVTAPTLLIVGGADSVVLELNRRAVQALQGPAELAVVPGATHLFAEPGALEAVADLAVHWFERYLP